jgi:integration host factor subunit beta
MNKSELILRLAKRYPRLYASDVERIVNTILGEITEALVRGDRVELRGFGAFFARKRNARTGRNPRTGETVAVEARARPYFRTGRALHKGLNGSSGRDCDYRSFSPAKPE